MIRRASLSLRQLSALLLALAVPFFAGSCQSIAGIDERELGPCGHFCDVVLQNCKGDNLVYENRTKCMGVCELLPDGDSNEWQNKDTVQCRLHEAELAASASSEDLPRYCRSAGPEGVDCGGSCESYCSLYENACGKVQCGSHQNCVSKCAALRDTNEFDLVGDYEGNTLQCRFVHLSNASIIDGGGPHCGHALLQTPSEHCTDVPLTAGGEGGAGSDTTDHGKPSEPICSEYCRVNTVACGTTEYESKAQCLALCPYFTVGAFTDTTQNTLGCRIYHSYNALCASEAHCPHSGPGGEGHCGAGTDKCAQYCQLAKGVCGTDYKSHFADGDDACMYECAGLPDALPSEDGPYRYTVAVAATPATLACRFLALSRAAEDKTLCATKSAFGEGDCAE